MPKVGVNRLVFFCLILVCDSSTVKWNMTWGDSYDVFHLTHLIEGHEWASVTADFFHSGVGFRRKTWPYDKFVAEFWAKSLNIDTIIPKLENGQEVFNNAVIAEMSPVDDFAGWKMHKVGSVSEYMLDYYQSWISQWMFNCPGYQLWSISDSMEMTNSATMYLRECDCHRFAEDSFVYLYGIGAEFNSQEPFCRNYFPLLSRGRPEAVSGYDPQLRSFYKEFRAIVEQFSMRDVLHEMFAWVDQQYQPYFYVFQSVMNEPGQFYYVPLDSPRFLNLPHYSSQRMMLPWQDNSQVVFCSYSSQVGSRAESQTTVMV